MTFEWQARSELSRRRKGRSTVITNDTQYRAAEAHLEPVPAVAQLLQLLSDLHLSLARSAELAFGLPHPRFRPWVQSWMDHSGQYRSSASTGSSSWRSSIMA